MRNYTEVKTVSVKVYLALSPPNSPQSPPPLKLPSTPPPSNPYQTTRNPSSATMISTVMLLMLLYRIIIILHCDELLFSLFSGNDEEIDCFHNIWTSLLHYHKQQLHPNSQTQNKYIISLNYNIFTKFIVLLCFVSNLVLFLICICYGLSEIKFICFICL